MLVASAPNDKNLRLFASRQLLTMECCLPSVPSPLFVACVLPIGSSNDVFSLCLLPAVASSGSAGSRWGSASSSLSGFGRRRLSYFILSLIIMASFTNDNLFSKSKSGRGPLSQKKLTLSGERATADCAMLYVMNTQVKQ